MAPLNPGRIIWATAPDARGGGKVRPMVIVSRRLDRLKRREFLAVACSTDFDLPLLDEEVLLPSDAEARALTGLTSETVAVCDWIIRVPVDQISRMGGQVPPETLREILKKAGILGP